MKQDKKKIAIAMLICITLIIIAIILICVNNKNKTDKIDINKVDTILVVNNTNNTTKTIDSTTQDAINIINSLNELKLLKIKDNLEDKVGEVIIYNQDNTKSLLVFYQNGITFNNKNYGVENFNFVEWYNKISAAETPFERDN